MQHSSVCFHGVVKLDVCGLFVNICVAVTVKLLFGQLQADELALVTVMEKFNVRVLAPTRWPGMS
jgi:nicotinamidase-related amidase